MSISIVEKKSGIVLAKADAGTPSLLKFEGNLYFSPDAVNAKNLKVTARTYTCPYKGTCNWVDFVGDDGETAKDVAWRLRALRWRWRAVPNALYSDLAKSRGLCDRRAAEFPQASRLDVPWLARSPPPLRPRRPIRPRHDPCRALQAAFPGLLSPVSKRHFGANVAELGRWTWIDPRKKPPRLRRLLPTSLLPYLS